MTHSYSKIALAGIAIVMLQMAIGVAIFYGLPDWSTRGQFGDLFGSVNALFSGLAFAGLIYTILLQREELSLQRRELTLTRQELQRAAAAQEQAEIALRAQAAAAASSAKLAATNLLLNHYQDQLDKSRDVVLKEGDPKHGQLLDLRRKEAALFRILESVFTEITEDE